MPYYITTPIYYLNDKPHIGHAYTTLAADIWTRARRLFGEPVYFLTGTDEHGANIEKIARQAQKQPQQWTDDMAAAFEHLWDRLNIQYDDFIRTTQPRHIEPVQQVFAKLYDAGHIYKGVYEGWYCLPCENFLEEDDVIGGQCPVHKKPVERLKEDSYFFRLSHFQPALLKHFREAPQFLSPKHRASEIINFVSGGLKDLSVSRTRVKWGIPVSFDPAHTIYVWFDALLNYLTALGYSPNAAAAPGALFSQYWPATIQLVGKEIYRFHAVIWPAMLMGLGLPLPRMVFAHGWWTVEGEKMSKSRGNVVAPENVVAQVPRDALRYYLFREMPFGSDGDFSMSRLQAKMNSELADNFGNLHFRLLAMAQKYSAGKIRKKGPFVYLNQLRARISEINSAYFNLEYHRVLEILHESFALLNNAVDQKAPWRLAKEGKTDEVEVFLADSLFSLAWLSYIFSPVCPDSAGKLLATLGLESHPKQFDAYLQEQTQLLALPCSEPLFPKEANAVKN